MRPAAEIKPVALLVDLDLLVGRDGVYQFNFERLAHLAEGFLRLFPRPDFLREGFVARDDLAHLFFDHRQVFQCERLVAGEVVVEAVFDHRADGHLCARPQILHRFGKHVSGIMPDQFERTWVVAWDKFDPGVAVDRVAQIGEGTVEHHGDSALCQRGRDALGNIKAGCA